MHLVSGSCCFIWKTFEDARYQMLGKKKNCRRNNSMSSVRSKKKEKKCWKLIKGFLEQKHKHQTGGSDGAAERASGTSWVSRKHRNLHEAPSKWRVCKRAQSSRQVALFLPSPDRDLPAVSLHLLFSQLCSRGQTVQAWAFCFFNRNTVPTLHHRRL